MFRSCCEFHFCENISCENTIGNNAFSICEKSMRQIGNENFFQKEVNEDTHPNKSMYTIIQVQFENGMSSIKPLKNHQKDKKKSNAELNRLV